ncbi:hypothetical protein ACQKPE_13985 [Pseudomonas sp. NPDC089554]|uniref:hypothetical protein n=1 Tax=Pseudomonas sp. NPDC089554 TaxID=3390653 RepID=UPI003D00643C
MARLERSPTWNADRQRPETQKALEGPFLFSAGEKKGRFDPPTFFSVVPACPKHHPDESHRAMSLAIILERLCQSVGTVRILAIPAATATGRHLKMLRWKYFHKFKKYLKINQIRKHHLQK